MKPKKIKIESFGTIGKGVLSVAQIQKDVPYDVKRVVWMYGVEDREGRGHHANIETIQTFFCLNGTIKVSLLDEFGLEENYEMSERNEGLIVPPNYWRILVFSPDAILLVLNSHDYKELDYIREMNDFLVKK